MRLKHNARRSSIGVTLDHGLLINTMQISILQSEDSSTPNFLMRDLRVAIPKGTGDMRYLSQRNSKHHSICHVIMSRLPILIPPMARLLSFVHHAGGNMRMVRGRKATLYLHFHVHLYTIRFTNRNGPKVVRVTRRGVILLPLPNIGVSGVLRTY